MFRYISSKSFSKLLFARLLNVACIFFVFWSLQFALSFSRWFKAGRKVITLGAGILLAAEWAVYDPKMYVRLYRVVYPFFFTAPQMTVLQKRLNVLFQGINVTVLLFAQRCYFDIFGNRPGFDTSATARWEWRSAFPYWWGRTCSCFQASPQTWSNIPGSLT